MGQVMLQLPETLQKELEVRAKDEGVALAEYIVYTLTRQILSGYLVQFTSPEAIEQQHRAFEAILERWGQAASDVDVDAFLAAREIAEPEPELTPELIAKVQARIAAAREQKEKLLKESV